MVTRVVGIGQRAAGDDGVGHAVLDALAAAPLPACVELCRVREASALVPLLDGAARVVVVDAVLNAGAPGSVHQLVLEQLDGAALSAVSSHGVGVAQALALARVLADDVARDVHFVAVSIAQPNAYGHGLSAPVAAAVPRAVEAVMALLQPQPAADNPEAQEPNHA